MSGREEALAARNALLAQRRLPSTQVTLVTGPPCGGKNTYVAEHAKPGDLIVDFDALVRAVGNTPTHDHPATLVPFAFDARDAVLDRLWSGRHAVRQAWVILSAPTAADRRPYKTRGCRIVMVLADRTTLQRRASKERPDAWSDFITRWIADHDTAGVDEVIDTSTEREVCSWR